MQYSPRPLSLNSRWYFRRLCDLENSTFIETSVKMWNSMEVATHRFKSFFFNNLRYWKSEIKVFVKAFWTSTPEVRLLPDSLEEEEEEVCVCLSGEGGCVCVYVCVACLSALLAPWAVMRWGARNYLILLKVAYIHILIPIDVIGSFFFWHLFTWCWHRQPLLMMKPGVRGEGMEIDSNFI